MNNSTEKIKRYFKGLHFDEGPHTYSVKDASLPSVSKIISSYNKPFETLSVSKAVAKKNNTTQEKVLKDWDEIREEACARGHRVHKFGEEYPYDTRMKPSCKQEEAVVKFWNDLPEFISPVLFELQMYHKELMYAGTCDILLYDRLKDTFIIADYKTNNDLFKNYNQKALLYPFDSLLDCPYNKYQIQLSLYQMLFEQTGFKVSSRKIIWLLKDGTYKLYDTEDYTNELYKSLTLKN